MQDPIRLERCASSYGHPSRPDREASRRSTGPARERARNAARYRAWTILRGSRSCNFASSVLRLIKAAMPSARGAAAMGFRKRKSARCPCSRDTPRRERRRNRTKARVAESACKCHRQTTRAGPSCRIRIEEYRPRSPRSAALRTSGDPASENRLPLAGRLEPRSQTNSEASEPQTSRRRVRRIERISPQAARATPAHRPSRRRRRRSGSRVPFPRGARRAACSPGHSLEVRRPIEHRRRCATSPERGNHCFPIHRTGKYKRKWRQAFASAV